MQDAESAPPVHVSELLATASEQLQSGTRTNPESVGSGTETPWKPRHVITASLVSDLVAYVISLATEFTSRLVAGGYTS